MIVDKMFTFCANSSLRCSDWGDELGMTAIVKQPPTDESTNIRVIVKVRPAKSGAHK